MGLRAQDFPRPTLICIVGPTAVGKSAMALTLAKQFETEIVSADARQLYQELDIGTAKPTSQELAQVPHHFIDYLPPASPYSAAQFESEALALLEGLFRHHRVVVMAGGSTLYTDVLWYGLDDMPEVPPMLRRQLTEEWETTGLEPFLTELALVDPATYERIDRQNPRRVLRAIEIYRATGNPISFYQSGRKLKVRPFDMIKIGLFDEREALYQRIDQRVKDMIQQGLEQEVRTLLAKGYDPTWQSMQSIGYREFYPYVEGTYDLAETIRLIQRNSRRYAKRQLTYWRRDTNITWFKSGQHEGVADELRAYIGRRGNA